MRTHGDPRSLTTCAGRGHVLVPVVKMESACKPGSVEDDHSSGIAVTGDLKRPTRKHAGTRAAAFAATSLFGLAPGGVCRAVRVTTSAVRSYRTVSPLPVPLLELRRFAFCCTFRRLTPPRRYLAPCPQGARTFLHISRETQRSPGRLRRAPYRHAGCRTSLHGTWLNRPELRLRRSRKAATRVCRRRCVSHR